MHIGDNKAKIMDDIKVSSVSEYTITQWTWATRRHSGTWLRRNLWTDSTEARDVVKKKKKKKGVTIKKSNFHKKWVIYILNIAEMSAFILLGTYIIGCHGEGIKVIVGQESKLLWLKGWMRAFNKKIWMRTALEEQKSSGVGREQLVKWE